MSERRISSDVEVAVDPDVAFEAFTAELDLWWVRGPINFHDSGRAAAMRCEPGVGGRLLEVYDEAAGDVLELARITAWEPGVRLAWQSSIDDVETEIRFDPSAGGTTVHVVARIPMDGSDRGGTAWTRVVPSWFGDWCARRHSADRVPDEIGRLAVGVYYERPAAAARWLADVFGFRCLGDLPEEPDSSPEEPPWLEFRIGNGSLMLFRREGKHQGAPSHVPWVYVDDVGAHFDRARAKGAAIVEGLHDGWGLPLFVTDDLEGNRWTIAQARPTMP